MPPTTTSATGAARTTHPQSGSAVQSNLPYGICLELTVQDAETIDELCQYAEGPEREQFALRALRIGVLALRQARGQFDAEKMRQESEHLLEMLQTRFEEHSRLLNERLTGQLKEYFDPGSGRFHERIDRLIRKDGELEQMLRQNLAGEDSHLSRTLSTHVGDGSQLMQSLDPQNPQSVLRALEGIVDEQLTSQRELVLRQFSLDEKDGALARFINEISEQNGELSANLHEKIEQAVRQFSLDDEDSALSRLVDRVTRAQQMISKEFSLDEERSALSRLKLLLEETRTTINNQLSLDEENSPLARLKREMLGVLDEQQQSSQKFQEEVKLALNEMVVRKAEAARSTRHGIEFEEAVCQQIVLECQRLGDVVDRRGANTGLINHCKVGDCVIELGPENAAAGSTLVVEIKEEAAYSLPKARAEIETARKNRGCEVGLFVFSKRTAPDGLEPLCRYANDVFVQWDQDDPSSDLILKAGIALARALCVRVEQQRAATQVDFTELDRAILEIEKRCCQLDEVETWTKTISKSSEKILKKIASTRRSLDRQVGILRDATDLLKQTLAEEG